MKLQERKLVFAVFFLWCLHFGEGIRCYECMARVAVGDTDPCLYGDETRLRRVHCVGPSVCATYHYQSVAAGAPASYHITRGCQALRYGATCEDIFHQLRRSDQVLPGHHTCTTCNTDLCNSSNSLQITLLILLPIIASLF